MSAMEIDARFVWVFFFFLKGILILGLLLDTAVFSASIIGLSLYAMHTIAFFFFFSDMHMQCTAKPFFLTEIAEQNI